MQTYDGDLATYEQLKRKRSITPPVKPDEPKADRFICSDATTESLAPLLVDNPNGLLLARDELNGWFGSFDRYASGKGDSAHWLEMFGAKPVMVDRKTNRQAIFVPRANISITGSIQPGVLDKALGDEHFHNGMAARFLMCMPPVHIKKWTDAELPAATDESMFALFEHLGVAVANTQKPCSAREVLATLTPKAREIFKRFCNKHAEEQAGLPDKLAATWAKLEAYCARFALLFHMVRWADGDKSLKDVDLVDHVSVACAERLVVWFGSQAERVYAVLVEDAAEREAREIIERIQVAGGSMSVRDYQRTSRRFNNNPELARQELNDLASFGYGRLETHTPSDQGGRPTEIFHLHEDPASPIPPETAGKEVLATATVNV